MAPPPKPKSLAELFALRKQLIAITRTDDELEPAQKRSALALAAELIDGVDELLKFLPDGEPAEDESEEDVNHRESLGVNGRWNQTELYYLRAAGLSVLSSLYEPPAEGPAAKKRKLAAAAEPEETGFSLLEKAAEDLARSFEIIFEQDADDWSLVLFPEVIRVDGERAAIAFLGDEGSAKAAAVVEWADTLLGGLIEVVGELSGQGVVDRVDPVQSIIDGFTSLLLLLEAVDKVRKSRQGAGTIQLLVEFLDAATEEASAVELGEAGLADRWRRDIAILRADVAFAVAGWEMEGWEAAVEKKLAAEQQKKVDEAAMGSIRISIDALKDSVRLVNVITGSKTASLSEDQEEKLREAFALALKVTKDEAPRAALDAELAAVGA